jgi:hypothetical protein
MERSSVAVDRLDVLSYGPHARRSWIIHRRVLGEDLRIGILSIPPVQYDPRRWWTASEGVKAVAGEMLGLAWMVCCFRATPRATAAGIGVTIYSDYPRSDSYYRLRRFGGNSFHIASHPDASVTCTGRTDSEVVPEPGIWYRFRYQGFAERSGTRLRARVWREDEEEPSRWQIDCVDAAAHRVHGSPGLWAMGPGVKVWDDLGVVPLPGQSATSVGSMRRDHEAEPRYDEGFQSYPHHADPEGWLDTGALNSMEVAPHLFRTILVDANAAAFGTSSMEANIHSHLQVPGSADWSSYEFRGRMAILEASPKLVSE